MHMTIERDEVRMMREAFRKILSVATSGDRGGERDALETIRELARPHIASRRVVSALRRHVARVREILDGVGRG
jgi:hypothetical protein